MLRVYMIHSEMFLFLPRIVRLAATGPSTNSQHQSLARSFEVGAFGPWVQNCDGNNCTHTAAVQDEPPRTVA